MAKTERLIDGQGYTVKSREVFRFGCCDCGLTHKIVMVTENDTDIGVALTRHKRATSARRRHIPSFTRFKPPISEQDARHAIDGAISKGYQGVDMPPSADHWLMPYWIMGQKLFNFDSPTVKAEIDSSSREQIKELFKPRTAEYGKTVVVESDDSLLHLAYLREQISREASYCYHYATVSSNGGDEERAQRHRERGNRLMSLLRYPSLGDTISPCPHADVENGKLVQ